MYRLCWRISENILLTKHPRALQVDNILSGLVINNQRDKRSFYTMDGPSSDLLFNGVSDRYKGITVDSLKEPCNISNFPTKLEDSLKIWTENGKRGIWFKVALDQSDWVPVLTKNGFNFHHAREGFVMMYKWLPTSEPNNVPPYAHTNLGVGAVILNDKNQLLAVCEKYFEMPHWKLPGGYVERGEDIIDAAIREVKEETGIDTEFHSIVAFRHAHNMLFENSDIYMIVNLNPLSHEITQCNRELRGCQWMDVDEYLNHPNVHVLNRGILQKTLEMRKNNLKFHGKKNTYKMITMQKEFTVFALGDSTL